MSLNAWFLNDTTEPSTHRATLGADALSRLLHQQLNLLALNLNSNHLRWVMTMHQVDTIEPHCTKDVADSDVSGSLLVSRQLDHYNQNDDFHICESH
jgi:hypothetical protein